MVMEGVQKPAISKVLSPRCVSFETKYRIPAAALRYIDLSPDVWSWSSTKLASYLSSSSPPSSSSSAEVSESRTASRSRKRRAPPPDFFFFLLLVIDSSSHFSTERGDASVSVFFSRSGTLCQEPNLSASCLKQNCTQLPNSIFWTGRPLAIAFFLPDPFSSSSELESVTRVRLRPLAASGS